MPIDRGHSNVVRFQGDNSNLNFKCSYVAEAKRRVTRTDLSAACGVGTCGGRRSYDAAAWTPDGRVEWRQIGTPHRKQTAAQPPPPPLSPRATLPGRVNSAAGRGAGGEGDTHRRKQPGEGDTHRMQRLHTG